MASELASSAAASSVGSEMASSTAASSAGSDAAVPLAVSAAGVSSVASELASSTATSSAGSGAAVPLVASSAAAGTSAAASSPARSSFTTCQPKKPKAAMARAIMPIPTPDKPPAIFDPFAIFPTFMIAPRCGRIDVSPFLRNWVDIAPALATSARCCETYLS